MNCSDLTFKQILYARLSLFKGISAQLVSKPVTTDTVQNGANASDSSSNKNVDHYYEMLLGLCERLFENEIEQHMFEDQMRAVFGLKVNCFSPH